MPVQLRFVPGSQKYSSENGKSWKQVVWAVWDSCTMQDLGSPFFSFLFLRFYQRSLEFAVLAKICHIAPSRLYASEVVNMRRV